MFQRPAFFPSARLNFAENLLFPTQKVNSDGPAIIAATETGRETVTWTELRERVRLCQSGMIAANVQAGDRVAGFVANHTNALVAMLAATSLGAIWTAVSPDTGVTAVLDRMTQIEPVLLLCDNAVIYNGKTHPTLPKVEEYLCRCLLYGRSSSSRQFPRSNLLSRMTSSLTGLCHSMSSAQDIKPPRRWNSHNCLLIILSTFCTLREPQVRRNASYMALLVPFYSTRRSTSFTATSAQGIDFSTSPRVPG